MVADALAPTVTGPPAVMILLSKLGTSLFYTRDDFNYKWHVNVEEW